MTSRTAAILEGVHGEAPVLEDVFADAVIDGLMAEVTVTQTYRNREKVNIEAVYTFPLPAEGVLLGFEAEVDGRRLEGRVIEKSDAERRYEDAVTDGDAAVMLEKSGPELYTASVGNLQPGEAATIRFRYGLLLRWNRDTVRFHMPTTIAPRYGDPASGTLAPHQYPEYTFDAERSFGLKVTVRGILKDAIFTSASHEISTTKGADEAIIVIARKAAMDRDFVLRARLSQPDAGTCLVARDLNGWVALASFRPAIPESREEEHRSIKIVVDCSGSMGGDSIAQARTGVSRIIDGLRIGDLFEIVAFGSHHHCLFGREAPVTGDSLDEARHFARSLDACMGGTEIGSALEAAYSVGGEEDLPRDLLLITDGEVWKSSEVIERARRSGHRIFTVGVGSAVAEAFVRGIADATGGACELVSPAEDMAERIHRHFQRMYAHRARDARVSWPVTIQQISPDKLEAVYDGDTVHVFAWSEQKPAGRVCLELTRADGSNVIQEAKILPFAGTPAVREFPEGSPLSSLARLGAARRLRGASDPTAGADLAVTYQLMSEWTSYLVVHVRAEAERAEDLPEIRKVRHVLAAGWHGVGTVRNRVHPASLGAELARKVVERNGLLADTDTMPLAKSMSASGRHDLKAERRAREEAEALHAEKRDLRARIDFERRRGQTGKPVTVSPDHEALQFPGRRASSTNTVDPRQIVSLINEYPAPPLPTLDDIVAWGLPQEILRLIRHLLRRGEDEAVVTVALLHALAGSGAGKVLERQIRRQILRAYKTSAPCTSVSEQIVHAVREWCEGALSSVRKD